MYPDGVVCSADNFFLCDDGTYSFDRDKLPEAHNQCQTKASEACSQDHNPIIIDNTNVSLTTTSLSIKGLKYNFILKFRAVVGQRKLKCPMTLFKLKKSCLISIFNL